MAESIVAHPGVTMVEASFRGNAYRGTGAALIAAGLVRPHQLPGQPTSGKTMAGFLPDGTRIKRQGSNAFYTVPGYVHIKKTGRDRFEVTIQHSREEMQRRRERERIEQEQRRRERDRIKQEQEREGLRLQEFMAEWFERKEMERRVLVSQRKHLRLVWSAA